MAYRGEVSVVFLQEYCPVPGCGQKLYRVLQVEDLPSGYAPGVLFGLRVVDRCGGSGGEHRRCESTLIPHPQDALEYLFVEWREGKISTREEFDRRLATLISDAGGTWLQRA